ADIFLKHRDFLRARKYAVSASSIDVDCEYCVSFIADIDDNTKKNNQQRLYGTLQENYYLQFWKNSYNFKMAVVYCIEKYHLPLKSLSEKLLQRLCQLRPLSPDPWLLNSWHYYQMRKYDIAIELVKKGLQLDAGHAQLWVNLGMYQLAAGQSHESLVSLQKSLELYPGYPQRREVTIMIAAARKKLL
ncbi:MAG: hypothetical protein KAI17_09095, partial [Thiotrichaceae bacterium]|nr:hypothetical protein [Thiotrichaceae bacterium]